MAGFDFDSLTDGLRTVFLAGVGAMATTAEKGKEVVDELVRKGELTVDQGKALNTELSRKAEDTAKSAFTSARSAFDDARDTVTRARLSAMSEAERKAYVERVVALSAELDEKGTSDSEAKGDAAESEATPAEDTAPTEE